MRPSILGYLPERYDMTRVSTRWDQGKRADEATLIKDLVDSTALTPSDRSAITGAAARLVERIRTQARPGMIDRKTHV